MSASDVLSGVAYTPCTPEAGRVAVDCSGSELIYTTDVALDGGGGASDCWPFILMTLGRLVSGGGVAVAKSCRVYMI